MIRNKRVQGILFTTCSLVGLLLLVGCWYKPKPPGQISGNLKTLPSYSVTNLFVGGELTEVIQMTNGLSVHFTGESVVVWLREDSSIVVTFDRDTKKPVGIFLELPAAEGRQGQTVLDRNADGIPDMRQRDGVSTKEIFYGGDWVPTRTTGTNRIITIGGKEVEVTWTGHRWVNLRDQGSAHRE